MAEAVATAEDDKTPARSAGIPLKLVILIVGGTLLLGLGGTIAFMKFGGHKEDARTESSPSPQAAASGKQEESAAKTRDVNTPGAIYDVDPFIVNLADVPEARYLKLTVKLELDRPDVASDLGARVPQLRDTILILLSSKDAASLRTPQGKFQLKEELTQRANALLPKGGIRSAYFTEFVVQ
ncbi:MAG: fliL [Nitrospira sp.]|jgi:flagellar FliL protein|nr:fliL [Nitrospira sp.]